MIVGVDNVLYGKTRRVGAITHNGRIVQTDLHISFESSLGNVDSSAAAETALEMLQHST